MPTAKSHPRARHHGRTRRIFLAALLIASTVLLGWQLTRAQAWRDYQHQRQLHGAIQLRADGQDDAARARLRTILREDPYHTQARRELAELERHGARLEHAYLEYTTLAELLPQDVAVRLILAEMAREAQRLDIAEQVLDQALHTTESLAARRMRAELRFQRARFFGADQDARIILQTQPQDSQAWRLRGLCTLAMYGRDAALLLLEDAPVNAGADWVERMRSGQAQLPETPGPSGPAREFWPGELATLMATVAAEMHKRDWPAARAHAQQAAAVYPDSIIVPWLLSAIYFAEGQAEAAGQELQQALRAAPRSERVVTSLAWIWARAPGVPNAGERLMTLAEADPEFALPRRLAARYYMDAREPAKAAAALRRGLSLQPDSPIPHRDLAEHFLDLDQPTEALKQIRAGLARQADDRDLLLLLARLRSLQGDPVAAREALERILARRPDDEAAAAALALLLSTAFTDADALGQAAALAHQLEFNAPQDPAQLHAIGWVRQRQGKTSTARKWLIQAAKLAPQSPRIRFHLGRVYVDSKRADLAQSELQAALDSGIAFPERLEAARLLRSLRDQSAATRSSS